LIDFVRYTGGLYAKFASELKGFLFSGFAVDDTTLARSPKDVWKTVFSLLTATMFEGFSAMLEALCPFVRPLRKKPTFFA